MLKHVGDVSTCLSLDFQAEQAAKVEKMRQSILEGLNFSRQNHPLPFPPPPALPFYPASVYPRHFGPVPPSQGRGRGFAGESDSGNLSGWGRACGPSSGITACCMETLIVDFGKQYYGSNSSQIGMGE